jgi:dihydrofolate reductase
MTLNLIFARARNGVIGKDNTLPWHLPEDLAHFKQTTLGQPVVMGRKTWESLPPKFRPLPGRTNIVVTRQTDWQAEGAVVAHSIKEAVEHCPADSQVWVIGGAEVYALAMPLASRAVVTEIDADFEGDAFAPTFDASWQETARTTHVAANGLSYSLVTLDRTR